LVLDGKFALSEVNKWDLEDVYKALAVMEMRQDYKLAYDGFILKKDKK